MFDPGDSVAVFRFFATYKQACDSNGIHDVAAMWYGKHFMAKLAATSLVSGLYLKNKRSSVKLEGKFSS